MKPAKRRSLRRDMKVDFPELEKVRDMQPAGEFRSARRMFGQHKNMHSPGFSFGTNQVAKRYLDKLLVEVAREHTDLFSDVPSSPWRLSPVKPSERSELHRLRGELHRKNRELTRLRAAISAKSKLLPSGEEVQRLLAGAQTLAGHRSAMLRGRTESPLLDDTVASAHRLSPLNGSLPRSHSPLYTKKSPKVHLHNPITGE